MEEKRREKQENICVVIFFVITTLSLIYFMCEKIDDIIFAQSEKMLNKELMELTFDVVQ